MDISTLKRDPALVTSKLISSGDQYLAKERIKIMIPAFYEAKQLMTYGTETYFLGFYCIITADGHYAIDIAPTMIQTEPSQITRVDIDDMEYIVMIYDKGDAVIANDNVVKNEAIGYAVFNEILSKGLFPWWMTYEDAAKVFSKMREFTGSSVGDNRVLYEVIISTLARDPDNKSLQYRQGFSNKAELISRPPSWAPLRSVQYSATNTVAKISGSYFEEGVISAINDPTDRIERGEKILRL
ncbi:MAG: hypothetical protein M0R77_00610 [Gammaproteobacteria bacterium]|nr:hypothetical protein [Acholeplasmataceae bacterium]MCK9529055.1 hypothetical protein [Gammaproteobacteria bacterium]